MKDPILEDGKPKAFIVTTARGMLSCAVFTAQGWREYRVDFWRYPMEGIQDWSEPLGGMDLPRPAEKYLYEKPSEPPPPEFYERFGDTLWDRFRRATYGFNEQEANFMTRYLSGQIDLDGDCSEDGPKP